MKKRVIALMLCFLCIFTLVGCKEDISQDMEILENDTINVTNNNATDPIKEYCINYNLNGGANSSSSPKVIKALDEDVDLCEPTRYAYDFKGWYDNEKFEGEKIESINGKDLTKDISLYAKWELNQDYIGELPFIEISTQDGVLPYDKETYINCSFTLSNCEDETDNFSVSMKEEYGAKDSVGIRLRGNSTMTAEKKPYRIKFDKKKSLFGLDEAKSWVLLADYFDQSSIRNYTAFSLGEYFDNLDFTPTPYHVVLMINGEWKGLYLLCEQVDEKEGRAYVEADIDPSVDTDFPFLIEMDGDALKEGVTGVDNFQIEGLWPIEIKYPEYEDRGIEDDAEDVVFNYIRDYITAVYNTLYSTEPVHFQGVVVTFEDLVDVDSFIDYHLLNEVMYNPDSTWKSIYMHKTKDGKLKFGPVWDFDISFNDEFVTKSYKSYIECANQLLIAKHTTLFNLYLQKEENYNKVKQRWNEITGNVDNIIEDLRVYRTEIKDIAHKDAYYWYGNDGIFWFDMQYDYVRLFLYDRINFLNYAFNLNYSAFLELL